MRTLCALIFALTMCLSIGCSVDNGDCHDCCVDSCKCVEHGVCCCEEGKCKIECDCEDCDCHKD